MGFNSAFKGLTYVFILHIQIRVEKIKYMCLFTHARTRAVFPRLIYTSSATVYLFY